MTKKRLLGVSIVLVVVLMSATIPNTRFFEIAKNIEIYSSVYKTINEIYVDEVNPNHLLNATAKAMLAKLDPYTVYISEDKIEDFRTESTGKYGGIGASTIRLEGRVFISMVVPNGPAESAGIEIGDEVITASGVPVIGKSNDELNQLVRGQAKTNIVLGVRKNGFTETVDISVVRDKIIIENVPYFGIVRGNVGYIKFTQFTENGSKNITKAIKELKKRGATSLILDLRNNPGGLLHEAVNICNLFIPKGLPVVQTKGKRPENSNEFKTLNQVLDAEIPIAVLINRSSASASEIVSGTLQDYDRAIIVGQRSYGKGLVQNVRPLSYNAQLKVTIAKYYIPSGRLIQALDYTHRNQDGSVGSIPDSLKTAFKTSNGRTVYDGGGIDPDKHVSNREWPPLVVQLVQQGKIYTYANIFKLKYSAIAPPIDFEFSDSQFDEFVDWVISDKEFEYQSPLDKKLQRIESHAKSLTDQSENFLSTLSSIRQTINRPLKEELLAYKKEIEEVLEPEIALRYYKEAGGIEASLGNDKEIAIAVELLNNPTQYNTILSGEE